MELIYTDKRSIKYLGASITSNRNLKEELNLFQWEKDLTATDKYTGFRRTRHIVQVRSLSRVVIKRTFKTIHSSLKQKIMCKRGTKSCRTSFLRRFKRWTIQYCPWIYSGNSTDTNLNKSYLINNYKSVTTIYKHPSHTLLKKNGFTEQLYHEYCSHCFKEKSRRINRRCKEFCDLTR
ncbi:hypothetical protein HN011_004059 [Eciton burchellii]|nr:hypothetical protein HN011_004059 [Eciton burchellii]